MKDRLPAIALLLAVVSACWWGLGDAVGRYIGPQDRPDLETSDQDTVSISRKTKIEVPESLLPDSKHGATGEILGGRALELQKEYRIGMSGVASRIGPAYWRFLAHLLPPSLDEREHDGRISHLLYLSKLDAFHEVAYAVDWCNNLTSLRQDLFVGGFGRTLLDQIQSGRLPEFVDKMDGLSRRDVMLAKKHCLALPYLVACKSDVLRKVIRRDRDDAVRLLCMIDPRRNAEGLKSWASVIDHWGSRKLLDIEKRFGRHVLILAAEGSPTEDSLSRFFMRLGEKARGRFDRAYVMTMRYESRIRHAARKGKFAVAVDTAKDLILSLDEERFSEFTMFNNLLDLACEGRPSNRWGMSLMRSAGPAVGEVIYHFYPSSRQKYIDRTPGWQENNDDANVRKGLIDLLSYKAGEYLGLLLQVNDEGKQTELRSVMTKLGQFSDDDRREILLSLAAKGLLSPSALPETAKNKAKQLAEKVKTISPEEEVLDLLPLYSSTITFWNYAQGYHISNLELGLAVLDAAMSVVEVGPAISKGALKLAAKGTKSAVRAAGHKTTRTTIAKTLTKAGKATVKKVGKKTRILIDAAGLASRGSSDDAVTLMTKLVQRTSKRMGIKTTGVLDPRILMRGDRRVKLVFDLTCFKEFVKREVLENAMWESAFFLFDRALN